MEIIISRNARVLGAIFCIAYILIQLFQWYAFKQTSEPDNLSEALISQAMPIHIWRSTLLLLSFFLLIYVFFVIILQRFYDNILLYTLAFIGLLVFCLLEIGIRSVELFYIQLQLPADFLNTTNDLVKNSIINTYQTFQSVQRALYFPLLFFQLMGSGIIALIFSPKPKSNYLIRAAFAINAVRLLGRILGMYFNIIWLNELSSIIYLSFVFIFFGSISFWFIKSIKHDHQTQK